MTGVIYFEGVPVPDIKLIRTVNLSRPIIDEVETDKLGRFMFPAIVKRSFASILPQEFAVHQEILAIYKGIELRIWSSVKRKPDGCDGSEGNRLDVICELNSEEKLLIVNGSPIFTRCDWGVVPDEKREIVIFDHECIG